MSRQRGFIYPLAPVLATRGWDLDARRADLGEVTVKLAAQQRHAGQLTALQQAAAAQWQAALQAGQAVGVDMFCRMHGYTADLARQLRTCEADIAALESQRAELAELLRVAQRALEAVEEHRDKAIARHAQAATSRDFAAADDQWNSLQTRSAVNER